jgi:hypothetical protein
MYSLLFVILGFQFLILYVLLFDNILSSVSSYSKLCSILPLIFSWNPWLVVVEVVEERWQHITLCEFPTGCSRFTEGWWRATWLIGGCANGVCNSNGRRRIRGTWRNEIQASPLYNALSSATRMEQIRLKRDITVEQLHFVVCLIWYFSHSASVIPVNVKFLPCKLFLCCSNRTLTK